MFTGLVEAIAEVSKVEADGHGGAKLQIKHAEMAKKARIGESICVNGACLTVVKFADDCIDFELGPETLKATSLGELVAGSSVNLERALAVGDRLGGHIVTGHIDCVGILAKRENNGDWQKLWFNFEGPKFNDLVVIKGSLAVDGVSLTLVDVEPGQCSVMLIPHTIANTILGNKPEQAKVNLEFDIVAKHVQKMFHNLTIEL